MYLFNVLMMQFDGKYNNVKVAEKNIKWWAKL
jgi:hypothetical protein